MSDTPRTDIREFTGFLNAGETAVSSDFARQLERENVELKAEIKKLRSVVLTIQVLECDMHKLKGHECFAKHWALSLLDRVKRMKKGGSMSDIKIVDWPKSPAEQRRDELERENAELRKLVEQMRGALSILGRIWFYGDFKPETPNEKHLSVMMKEMGFKYESENEVLAALEAAER